MKQIISHLLITTLLIVLLLLKKSYSIKYGQDSMVCLEIKGKILNIGNKSSDTYKVEPIYLIQL